MSKEMSKENTIKILSLFDGISCAQIVLKQLGLTDYIYLSSEIDENAINITKKNFPNTINIGNVCDIKTDTELFKNPYLLIGGSPCQNLSSRGNKKGLEGEKSSLFYEYKRILLETKPDFFLLENVGSMSLKNRDIITNELQNVYGSQINIIKINSSLFVPQNRRRYYWTNIPIDKKDLPVDNVSISVKDILEEKVEDSYYYSTHNKERSFIINSFNSKPEADLVIARTLKTQAYTGRAGVDNCYHTKYKPSNKTNLRKLTPLEYERLQGIPDNYTSIASDTQRYKCIGNSFTVPVIKWFLNYILVTL